MINSYRAKLLLVLLGLVVLLQASSYVATRIVIRDAVLQDAYRKLEQGSQLFSQLMQTRAQQLSQSVSVLTDDFGFKEAVATADRATIRSALINHSARVQADIALVLDNDKGLVASSVKISEDQLAVLEKIDEAASAGSVRYFPIIINNTLYQFVLSPIRAPLQIGTAGIGFEIDQALSAHLKTMTGLEVSFIATPNNEVQYLSGTLLTDEKQRLLQAEEREHWLNTDVWRSGDMLSSSVSVAKVPDQVTAVLQVPLATALKPFAVLDTQLLSLALSFFIGATLIALVFARSVTKPVQLLAKVARKIAGGQYDSPVQVSGRDEFSELANAFNSMQTAISEREQEIRYQAEHDSLTTLANRSQVFPCLSKALELCQEDHKMLVVMIVDIYKFTQINDTLSPEMGDEVLREVGAKLQALVSVQGTAIRLGSDEFLLINPVASMQHATAFAEQIEAQFEHSLELASTDIKVELNIGFTVYPDQGGSPELLLRRANLALNKARQSHLFIVQYEAGWDEDHLRRLQLFADFKEALINEEICLHYQPKVGASDGSKIGAEALIRWMHPTFGFVNPEEFIAVIESAGQISLLTRWVIRAASMQAKQLWSQGHQLRMSVNLSALDLLEDDLPDFIRKILQELELPPEALCLEITESAIMQETERSLANLNRLHNLGLMLSIDDYGTGYSSLSQMKQLPVGELKIDKSFVMDLDSNEEDRQIVKSTIELGHTLGLKVTAEGVETELTRDWLIANGCDTLQGYFYSKPVPARDFHHWLEQYLQRSES
ncbi:EAL domain-containing protein [Gilvimarinus sp. SDUM040013]|uniref:EAL domain-containing protein n=1 Tax=Gilvimarinus gilvus TaxID=3058038 RepID=A0ABU4S519_9GAMM|nr:EAL domain-containing protein [Gilvimarinus sp. SDUM040013]MDO3388090.1 EAL domain-containing protein [Gilvimarinus sp. SDUM040013]MDX6850998.1 EAL domain-containing protein [Gilvimarinus sp. SDUM040013]